MITAFTSAPTVGARRRRRAPGPALGQRPARAGAAGTGRRRPTQASTRPSTAGDPGDVADGVLPAGGAVAQEEGGVGEHEAEGAGLADPQHVDAPAPRAAKTSTVPATSTSRTMVATPNHSGTAP